MTQKLFLDFLKTRRSVTAKKMTRGNVTEDHLRQILEAGIRVPDHGALKPWKLKVIKGATQKQLDEEVIFAEFIKANPHANAETQSIEKNRFQRADTVIAVISSPVEHKSITEWEMHLSAGAVSPLRVSPCGCAAPRKRSATEPITRVARSSFVSYCRSSGASLRMK